MTGVIRHVAKRTKQVKRQDIIGSKNETGIQSGQDG